MRLSEKIVILRKRLGFSQEDLANELDVSRQSVYKWENEGAIPELDKIKKLSKLFNISLNELLDDEIDINTINPSYKETPLTPEKKFRQVFCSNEKLESYQADLDNGYTQERKTKCKQSDKLRSIKIEKMKEIIAKYGADSHTFLQHDLAGCFFVNSKNLTFGFYFNGAIQFICPFENFISANVSNSGNELSYKNKTVLGAGFGLDGLNSVGVGNIPIAMLNKPLFYELSISYFDNNGKPCEYKMSFNSIRNIYKFKKVEEHHLYSNVISESTEKHLNDVCAKLSTVQTVFEVCKSKNQQLEDLDIKCIKSEYAINSKDAQEYKRDLEAYVAKENKTRLINLLIKIGIGVVLVVILIILLT